MFKMWGLEEWCMLGFLAIAAVYDLVRREIPAWYLAIGTISVALMQIIRRKEEWYLLAFGIVTGILFLFLSKVTEQGIGYGDSWMILILGIFSGIWKLCVILGIAFLGAAAVAGAGLACKTLSRKSRLPFYPFLMIGFLGVVGW